MVSSVCGTYTNNRVTATLPTIILIIIKQSETCFTLNTLSLNFSANKTLTPPVHSSSPTQKHLYLESLPSIILADSPLHLHSCIQHKSIPLLDINSTTSLDLPLNVPTFRLAILNAFVFVYVVEFLIFTIWLDHNHSNQPYREPGD